MAAGKPGLPLQGSTKILHCFTAVILSCAGLQGEDHEKKGVHGG